MAWTRFDILYTGDDFYDSLLTHIQNAKSEILLESYIFWLDKIGEATLSALEQAAARGVSVYLTVDGIGTFYYLDPIRERCRKAGIHLRVYHGPPFAQRWYPHIVHWKVWTKLLKFFAKINTRNHRKLTVIDKRIGYIGSRNIVQVHSEKCIGASAWRDTCVLVEGEDVALMRDAFFSTVGRRPKGFVKRALLSTDVALNSTFRLRRKLLKNLLGRLRTAEKRIWITNAYFVPHRRLVRALKRAARAGVDVKLILPEESDLAFLQILARSYYMDLMKSGVKLYEYQKSILHAKTTVTDNVASIGSFNFNHRSLFRDLEVEALTSDPQALKSLEEHWATDLENSKLQLIEELEKRPLFEKIYAGLLYRLRHWL